MSNQQMQQVISALEMYKRLRWSTLPLHTIIDGRCTCNRPDCESAAKHPCNRNGVKGATQDSAGVESLLRSGRLANVGLATGEVSGVDVLDIDPRHGGDQSLMALVAQNGPLPSTVEAVTGGAGTHYFFQHVPRLKSGANVAGPGIDHRADGGYVVAPPSLHASGRPYVWKPGHSPDDMPLAVMPDWLAGSLQAKRRRRTTSEPLQKGGRNDSLFRFACRARAAGITEQVLYDLVMAENLCRCLPPLSEAEVKGIVGSALRYDQDSPYRLFDDGLYHIRAKANGEIERQRLTNFDARIVAMRQIVEDAQRRLEYEIELTVLPGGMPQRRFIPSPEFAAMAWVINCFGPDAIVEAGAPVKDRVRAAIQHKSRGNVVTRLAFENTGWVDIAGAPHYVTTAGALGTEGLVTDVDVELGGGGDAGVGMNAFALVAPTPDVVNSIRASLDILRGQLAPADVAVPAFAATYAGPLRRYVGTGFCLFLLGPTGVRKSSLAGIMQAHFGKTFSHHNLVENFLSTVNAMEAAAHKAKDAIATFDDFKPCGSKGEADSMHHKLERLLRAQGDGAGRSRLVGDGKFAYATGRPPRGLLVVTGEDATRVESALARSLCVELEKQTIRLAALTQMQQHAADGRLADSMAGFVCWCAKNDGHLKSLLPAAQVGVRDLLARDSAMHGRLPDMIATLFVASATALAFACQLGALDKTEATKLVQQSWHALLSAAAKQVKQQRGVRPAEMYLRGLRSALLSGQAHVVTAEGKEPPMATALGWHRSPSRALVARGAKLGWVEGDALYLNPSAAFHVVSQYGDGSLAAIGELGLRRELAHADFLVRTDSARQKRVVRKRFEGVDETVLHLSLRAMLDLETQPPTDDAARLDVRETELGSTLLNQVWPNWPVWPVGTTGTTLGGC